MYAHLKNIAANIYGGAATLLTRPGMKADLVVFDPTTVQDKADFQNLQQYAEGFRYVIVNGRPIIKWREVDARAAGSHFVRARQTVSGDSSCLGWCGWFAARNQDVGARPRRQKISLICPHMLRMPLSVKSRLRKRPGPGSAIPFAGT